MSTLSLLLIAGLETYRLNKINQEIDNSFILLETKLLLKDDINNFRALINNQNNIETSKLSNLLDKLNKNIESIPDKIQSLPGESQLKTIEINNSRARHTIMYITSLIQALGAGFFIVTAYYTAANVFATNRKQIAERFSDALGMLEINNGEKHLSGLFLLSTLINEAIDDRQIIIETLATFIRNCSNSDQKDNYLRHIHKAMKLLLKCLSLENDANKLSDQINLTGAYLKDIQLNSTKLENFNFNNANFDNAELRRSEFNNCSINDADFINAKLLGAKFDNVEILRTNFNYASLYGADFFKSDLGGTKFKDALIRGVNFINVDNLPIEQIKIAKESKKAKYNEQQKFILKYS